MWDLKRKEKRRKMNEILGNVYGVMLTWKAISDFAEALRITPPLYGTAKNGLKVH